MGTYVSLIILICVSVCLQAQLVLPTYKPKAPRIVESKLGALDRYKSFTTSLVVVPQITWIYANYTWETRFEFESKANITDTNWTLYTSTTNMFLSRPTNKMIFLRMRAYHKSLNYYSPYATLR